MMNLSERKKWNLIYLLVISVLLLDIVCLTFFSNHFK